mmetsp:Transcript_7281/g.18159  ORF Transcript_7281/g.18159 Transcript_7281/m.18159 type:complete len:323 (-) Transcript_7281:238-1206(-)
MCGSHSERAKHAAHLVLFGISPLLNQGDVEGLGHPASVLRGLELARHAEVDTGHTRVAYPQLLEALGDELPTLVLPRQADDVHGDVALEPLPSRCTFACCPRPPAAKLRPVAQIRRLEGREGAALPRRCETHLGSPILDLWPGPLHLNLSMALGLQTDPAPIALLRKLPPKLLLVFLLAELPFLAAQVPLVHRVHPSCEGRMVARQQLVRSRSLDRAGPCPSPGAAHEVPRHATGVQWCASFDSDGVEKGEEQQQPNRQRPWATMAGLVLLALISHGVKEWKGLTPGGHTANGRIAVGVCPAAILRVICWVLDPHAAAPFRG